MVLTGAEKAKYCGVMPAVVTPFDSEGELDEKAFCAMYEYNVQAGVQGFWSAPRRRRRARAPERVGRHPCCFLSLPFISTHSQPGAGLPGGRGSP